MIKIRNSSFDDFIADWRNPYKHVKFHIFIVVCEGSLHYELNGVHLLAKKGDWVYIPPGTNREAYNDEEPHQKYTVSFDSMEDWGLSLLLSRKPERMQSSSFDFLKERMIMLHRHHLNQEPYSQAICSGLLLEILGTANRELDSQQYPLQKLKHVRLIEQYIQENYRERIPLKRLASLVGRSPNYTLALFKELNGLTPSQYQHRLRITSSMEMLRNTELTVTAIAEHLGYYDASSFYKMFRKLTGMSPAAYSDNL